MNSRSAFYVLLAALAFALTLGAMLLLGDGWSESGHFPLPMLLGVALLAYFVATGSPQTSSTHEWQAGDVGVTRWARLLRQRGEANEVAPKLLGTWSAGARSYVIERDALTVRSPEGIETLSAARCAGRLYTFLRRADGTLLAFRDLHEPNPSIETLTR